MAMIDARCRLLGQAGALLQVRVYNGVPITSKPSGKWAPGSESSPETLISSPHLFTSSALWQLVRFPDACTSKDAERKPCGTRLCISCLCHRFFPVAVCAFPGVRCIYLCQSSLSLYIYFITYWWKKEKKKNKRKVLLCYQLSLPPWLCTCSFQVPFGSD